MLAVAMVSPWLAIPIAALGMLLVAGYTLSIQRQSVPPARRRLRTAMGVLYIFILAALAFGISIASPADRRTFVLCWMLVVGLVAVSVLLAAADALVTVRSALADRAADARRASQELAEALLKARERDGQRGGQP